MYRKDGDHRLVLVWRQRGHWPALLIVTAARFFVDVELSKMPETSFGRFERTENCQCCHHVVEWYTNGIAGVQQNFIHGRQHSTLVGRAHQWFPTNNSPTSSWCLRMHNRLQFRHGKQAKPRMLANWVLHLLNSYCRHSSDTVKCIPIHPLPKMGEETVLLASSFTYVMRKWTVK